MGHGTLFHSKLAIEKLNAFICFRGKAEAGQSILVHGASGAVSILCVPEYRMHTLSKT